MLAAVVLLWMGALSGYDVRCRRLPNWLTLPGAAAVLVGALVAGRGLPAAWGAATLAAGYLLVHLASPAAMGAGDVKLAIGLGALTGSFGPQVWVLAALGAPLLTALLAVVSLPWRAAPALPHGPSMCLASAAGVGLAIS